MSQRYLDPVVYDDGDFQIMFGFSNYLDQIVDVSIEPNGARGGIWNAWKFANAAAYVDRNFDNQSTWFVGFRVKLPTVPNLTRVLLSYRDTNTQVDVRIGNDRLFRVTRNGVVLGTTSYAAPINDWFYVEFEAIISQVGGYVELRVNESTKLALSGVNTAPSLNNYASGIRFHGVVPSMLMHDINIRDGNENEDFWGDTAIVARFADEDGDAIGFTGSDGDQVANYALVRNNPHLDAEYVYSLVNGITDLYDVEDLARVRILGVQDVILADMNQCYGGLYPRMKAGGIVYQDDLREVSPALAYILTQYQRSPNTNQLWTLSEFNRCQPGQTSYATATISGFVFFNWNEDGIYDPGNGDFPFPGTTQLDLYLDNGDLVFDPMTDTIVANLVTDFTGYWGAFGVTPGSVYWVYYSNVVYDTSTPNPIGPITATAECVTVSGMGWFNPPG